MYIYIEREIEKANIMFFTNRTATISLLGMIPTLKGDLEEGRAHVLTDWPDKGGHAD